MNKTRPAHDVAAVTEITGRVRDKVALVGDDVIMTGGTIIAGAQALLEHGATEVWVFATHAIFAGDALERFARADLAGIVVTDTVPIDPLSRPDNLTVLSVGELLADTIMNVFEDDSVSAIFGGENQLF
jgi:ribose-phosphate pyrophosphokinase